MPTGTRCRVVIAFVAVLAAVTAARAQDIPPTLLRRPVLLTPGEMAGTGLEPEVRVRIDVDERGRVVTATVLGITPASRFDDLLCEVTEKSALDWRFAPARQGGAERAATLEWTLKFRATANAAAAHDLFSPLLAGVADPRQPDADLSALPPADRRKVLDRYTAAAESNLRRGDRKRFDSPRFVVVTDAGTAETAKALAGNLEAVFNVLHDIFDSHVAPQPQAYKLVGYLFADKEAFLRMRSELGLSTPMEGFYKPPGLFAFHAEMPTQEDLLSVMLHETVHAYSDVFLRRPGVLFPLWIEEGLAEYFANSRIKGGQLLPGKTLRGRFMPPHFGVLYRRTQAGATLDHLRRAVRSGEAPSVNAVMRASFPVFYGDDAPLYYGLSWLLVHFLRHGDESWAGAFPEIVLYLAEGYDPGAALRTVYGLDEAAIEERFRRYVRDF
ncbi:MAG TPA: hypothetical protein VMS86_09005 [Thermoanaerobaculia bacterium]|nr:hypothetical protein [Thermoanaerobaculia bacterium]